MLAFFDRPEQCLVDRSTALVTQNYESGSVSGASDGRQGLRHLSVDAFNVLGVDRLGETRHGFAHS